MEAALWSLALPRLASIGAWRWVSVFSFELSWSGSRWRRRTGLKRKAMLRDEKTDGDEDGERED